MIAVQNMIAVFFLVSCITSGALGVECPAPRSPEGGQALLLAGGRVVQFSCRPPARLIGPERVACLDGRWETDFPLCSSPDEVATLQPPEEGATRGLFSWGQDEDNSTDEALMGDEASKSGRLPSLIYVRRAASFPRRAAVVAQNDKGEEYLRRLYYHNNYYYHQQPYYNYYHYQQPALSESQLAWIHSLPPELRDQYLRNYNFYYDPLYLRQPMARGDEEAVADYSCNRAGAPFVAAPRVARARVLRYERRQGRRGAFLAAVYRCDAGFSARSLELFCSAGRWIGHRPVCLPTDN